MLFVILTIIVLGYVIYILIKKVRKPKHPKQKEPTFIQNAIKIEEKTNVPPVISRPVKAYPSVYNYKDIENNPPEKSKKIPKLCFRTSSYSYSKLPQEAIDAMHSHYLDSYSKVYFDDADCLNFIRDFYPEYLDNYESLIPGAYKCDYFRLLVLYRYGGVYNDIGHQYLQPIDTIINEDDEFVSVTEEWIWGIHNAFIACYPQHPFIKLCIDQITNNIFNKVETFVDSVHHLKGIFSITGPQAIGAVFNDFMGYKKGEFIKEGVHIKDTLKFKLFTLSIIRTKDNDKDNHITYKGMKYIRTKIGGQKAHYDIFYKQEKLPHYSELFNMQLLYKSSYMDPITNSKQTYSIVHVIMSDGDEDFVYKLIIEQEFGIFQTNVWMWTPQRQKDFVTTKFGPETWAELQKKDDKLGLMQLLVVYVYGGISVEYGEILTLKNINDYFPESSEKLGIIESKFSKIVSSVKPQHLHLGYIISKELTSTSTLTSFLSKEMNELVEIRSIPIIIDTIKNPAFRKIYHYMDLESKTFIQYETQIPKIVFRTSFHRYGELPKEFDDAIHSVYLHDYTKVYFDEVDRLNFIRDFYPEHLDNYETLIPGAIKSDYFRLLVLYRYGGVYNDIGNDYVMPINSIIENEDEFISSAEQYIVGIHNGFIACYPRHPFIKLCIELFNEKLLKKDFSRALGFGPILLGEAYNIIMGRNKDTMITEGIEYKGKMRFKLLVLNKIKDGKDDNYTLYGDQKCIRVKIGGGRYYNKVMYAPGRIPRYDKLFEKNQVYKKSYKDNDKDIYIGYRSIKSYLSDNQKRYTVVHVIVDDSKFDYSYKFELEKKFGSLSVNVWIWTKSKIEWFAKNRYSTEILDIIRKLPNCKKILQLLVQHFYGGISVEYGKLLNKKSITDYLPNGDKKVRLFLKQKEYGKYALYDLDQIEIIACTEPKNPFLHEWLSRSIGKKFSDIEKLGTAADMKQVEVSVLE